MLYPFILRPLAEEQWVPPRIDLWDLVTPYGYGGPFAWGNAFAAGDVFWREVEDWLHARRVVCSFLRLSLFPDELLGFPGEVIPRSMNVVRSLNLSDDELWRDYEHKVRKNVKRALRSSVSVNIEYDGSRIGSFIDIYVETMERRSANEFYRFGPQFFERLVDELVGNFAFAYASVNGQVVSTELILVSAGRVYSFLGGTRTNAFDMRPNDLLKHEVIMWARDAGKREYVLGGGYVEGDGILRYKRSFAPSGLTPFHIATKVHDHRSLDELVRRRGEVARRAGYHWVAREEWFPPYRS
ncbi:MAG: GNAT family N-acetyltransferase [Actinomycetota bacterium]|nr:GNAT family N-acetyltransferase [Actinomycetota bacterium]